MSQYDFQNLSSYDFEVLIHGLMEAELGVRLERFSTGRDDGIDLRYTTDNDGQLVIQCKHFARSSYSSLLTNLRAEVPKVARLAPQRYKIVTSVRLTPHRKDEIFGLFQPYMAEPADVLGVEDVNALLENFPEIERRNFKLWLTSTEVLSTVLHNDIFVRSKYLESDIAQKLRLYVPNRSFPEARDILRDRHVCIIAGVPGIGKTMLADMLLVTMLNDGYEPVAVSDDISEALDLYRPDRKQVFYYDDFLGQTTSLDKLGKNEDARLLDFIHQVGESGNKRLILTTREYMLAQARSRYERLDRADLDVNKCVIALASYSRFDKAKILYNHLYFSDLSSEYQQALAERRSHLSIVDHRNYSPRIIESVCRLASNDQVAANQFVEFFVDALDHPEVIWRHAFDNQLDAESQIILLLLFSMPPAVDVTSLRTAFRSVYTDRCGVAPAPTAFTNGLRTLEDNFVSVEALGQHRVVRFHNPSIRDFLRDHVGSEPDEYVSLLEHAQFFDQVVLLGNYAGLELTAEIDPSAEPVSTGLAALVSVQPDLLLEAFRQTLASPECRVMAMRTGNIRIAVEQVSFSKSERLRLALVAARKLGGEIPEWLLSAIESLTYEWTEAGGIKEDALALLRELNSAAGTTVAAGTATTMKAWFASSLDSAEDYEAFAELGAIGPDVISPDELREMSDDLQLLIPVEFQAAVESAESGGELEAVLDDFENVAATYALDLRALVDIELYESRLEELENLERAEEPDDDDEYWDGERDGRMEEDAAIASLFDSLNE